MFGVEMKYPELLNIICYLMKKEYAKSEKCFLEDRGKNS